MKHLKSLSVLCGLAAGTAAHAATWLTDLDAAKAQAAREGKPVLIDFTGSDWCGWCIKLKQEVFSQPEFEDYANRNLVLVEIDFPRSKPQSSELKKANRDLADRFRVQGYPSLVLLDSQGNEARRSGYQAGGARPFVQGLAKLIGVPAASQPATSSGPSADRSAVAPTRELPLFGGAPTAPPPRYTNLVLKSITGSKGRRFALLNNQTFGAGETARVKLEDKEVQVRCVEIRDHSVVVAVDGQSGQREIQLRNPL